MSNRDKKNKIQKMKIMCLIPYIQTNEYWKGEITLKKISPKNNNKAPAQKYWAHLSLAIWFSKWRKEKEVLPCGIEPKASRQILEPP